MSIIGTHSKEHGERMINPVCNAQDQPVHNSEVVEPTAAQNKRLLAHLRDGWKIGPISAWHSLGIYRLSARIYDLRKAGHAISMELVEVDNSFGEPCRVAVYKLEQGK